MPALLWPMTASAETKTTNDFVRLCAAQIPSEECLVEFQSIEAANNIAAAIGSGNTSNCAVAQIDGSTYDLLVAGLRKQVRAVLAWLKAHPQYGSRTDADGVGMALHAIYPYPCK